MRHSEDCKFRVVDIAPAGQVEVAITEVDLGPHVYVLADLPGAQVWYAPAHQRFAGLGRQLTSPATYYLVQVLDPPPPDLRSWRRAVLVLTCQPGPAWRSARQELAALAAQLAHLTAQFPDQPVDGHVSEAGTVYVYFREQQGGRYPLGARVSGEVR